MIKLENFEEQVFFSTVRIERPGNHTMGTGFLIQVPVPVKEKQYIFLISNRHVLDDPKKETKFIFHTSDKAGYPVLGDTFNPSVSEFTSGYYPHPDKEIDLALLNVSSFYDIAKTRGKLIYSRNLPTDLFCSFDEPEVSAGQRIVFVGYPADQYDKKNFLPILRGGLVASIPNVDYEGKPHVLIDAQVFPGSSGSPVFIPIKGKWYFLGVVCQTMVRNQKVQIQTAMEASTQEVLGIGIVIKNKCVRELVDAAVADLNKINGV